MVLAFITLTRGDWLWPAVAVALLLMGWMIWSHRLASSILKWGVLGKSCALLLLAICLGEPLWSSQQVRPGANLMLLLADNSQSLELVDPGKTRSRGEELRELLTEDTAPWHVRLEQDFDVRRYQFDGQPKYVADFASLDFSGDRSELIPSLKTLKERLADRPVAGILLFTDGVATDELPVSELTGLPPLYPVPVGISGGHRDLSIVNVNSTTTSFEDAPVSLQVEVRAEGMPAGPVIVRVDDEAGAAVQNAVQPLSNDGKLPVFRFQLRPIKTGVTFYTVRVTAGDSLAAFDQPSDETTFMNNTRLITVDRGTGPYRLLYISGRPNWELKFLKRALADDDQLKLTAMIRIARKEAKFDFRGRDGESANPLFRGFDRTNDDTERYDQPVIVRLNTLNPDEFRDGFPKTAEELFQFHALILDDLEAGFFTAEQLSLIERFVSERGGGCLMLGGLESFRQGGYEKTAIGRMLPVYLNAPPLLPPSQGYRLALTREGWLQPWARLRSTEADEVRQLREAAPVRVMNSVSGFKPGASTIAEVLDPSGRTYPALVEQRYGQGRSAALLVGDRWRAQLELTDDQRAADDLGKAWRQMLRWLIVDVPDRVELATVTDQSSGVPLMRLEARVRNEEFRSQDNAAVTFTVQSPDGPEMSLVAEPSLRESGLYETMIASRPSGAWRAKVQVRDADGKDLGGTATGWAADLTARELRQVSPDRERLKQMAELTGGRLVERDELESFVKQLPSKSAPLTETRTTPLWHHPLVWLLMVAGFCLDWGLRRRQGLP